MPGNIAEYKDLDREVRLLREEETLDLQSPLKKKNHPFNTDGLKAKGLTLENVLMNDGDFTTLPDLVFLRRGAIAREIIEKAAHELVFLPWMRTVEINEMVATYLRFLKAHNEDADKQDPVPIGPSGTFPRITRGVPVERQVSVAKHGFEVVFPHDAMFNVSTSFDYVDHTLEAAGYYYRDYLNNRGGVVLTNNFSTSQTGDEAIRLQQAAAVWSSATADPIGDILNLKRQMEGADGTSYYVAPTDLFLTPDNFVELLNYLRTVSQQWAQAPFQDVQEFMLYGIRIHNTPQDSGIQANKAIMLTDPDSAPPITMYHRTDNSFSRVGTLHVHEYMQDGNHDHVFQLWDYIGLANQNPQKVGMLHGL